MQITGLTDEPDSSFQKNKESTRNSFQVHPRFNMISHKKRLVPIDKQLIPLEYSQITIVFSQTTIYYCVINFEINLYLLIALPPKVNEKQSTSQMYYISRIIS